MTKTRQIFFFLLFLRQITLFGQFGKSQSGISLEKMNGLWVHSEDSSAIVEIMNKVWTYKYVGDTAANDIYDISIKDTVFGNSKTRSKILVLDNKTDEFEYEILGLNDQILSLMYLPAGRLHLYYRRTKTDR